MSNAVDEFSGAVGARVRQLRKLQGRTLVEMSAAMGITDGQLSRLERGESAWTFGTMISAARELRSSVPALMGARELEPDEADLVDAYRRAGAAGVAAWLAGRLSAG